MGWEGRGREIWDRLEVDGSTGSLSPSCRRGYRGGGVSPGPVKKKKNAFCAFWDILKGDYATYDWQN